ncbi:MAG: glycosyltransferase family 39 protein [Acidobacteriota bacterium]
MRSSGETQRLAAIGTGALLLRGLAAAARPPWHDEYFTSWAASLPLRELIGALRLDSGPPLPYLLAGLLAAFGLSALTAARLVAVLAGTGAVLVAARAAGRAFGPRAGWWCGLLLACHPLAIAWSSEGRAYALLMLAAAWGWERVDRIGDSGSGGVGLALAVALGCWSHALGLVLAGALAAAALVLPPARRRLALLAVAAGLGSHLPWLPVALAQPPTATAWMVQAWQALPLAGKALAPLQLLPPAAPFARQLDLPSLPQPLQLLAAALCLCLLAARRPAARPWLLFALPLVALAGLAWLGLPALYSGRAEALVLSAFAALLAAGATRNRATRLAAAALVAAALATSALAVRGWIGAPPSPERQLAMALERALPAGGTVVIGGYWRLGLTYHLGAEAGRYELRSFPATAARHPGWYDDASDQPAPSELADLQRELASEASRGRALAVLVAPAAATARALTELGRQLGLQPAVASPAAVLWLWPGLSATRRPPAPPGSRH